MTRRRRGELHHRRLCYRSSVFGVGPYEALVLLAIGLMLFSPRELPKVIKGFARLWGSVRRTADEFRDALMQDEDLREPIDELRKAYHGTRAELRQAEDQARRELVKARMELRKAEQKLAEASREAVEGVAETVPAQGASPDTTEPPAASPAVEASEARARPAMLPPPPGGKGKGQGLGAA